MKKEIEFVMGDPVVELQAWLKEVKLTPKQTEKLMQIMAVTMHDCVLQGRKDGGCCFAGVGQACPIHEKKSR